MSDTQVSVRGSGAVAAKQLAMKKNKRQSNHHRGKMIINAAINPARSSAAEERLTRYC